MARPPLQLSPLSRADLGALQIFAGHYRFAIGLHDAERIQLGLIVGKSRLVTLGESDPAFLMHRSTLTAVRRLGVE